MACKHRMIDADFVEDGRAQHTLCCGVQGLEHSGKDRAALPLWAIWFTRVQAGRGAAPTLEWGWDQAWSFIETVGNQRTIADQSEVVEQEERKAESEGVPQIWVDGSVSPNGSYGIGAWGMDESGKVIAVATDGGWGRWNPSEVEAKAILMGIDLAKKMKLKRFCLFSDCLEIINFLRKKDNALLGVKVLLNDVEFLCNGFEIVDWVFSRRTNNNRAHVLAQFSLIT